MELKGSRTEANLKAAFAGESQARNKYTYFANAARKEGFEQVAGIFEETADNEKEHAKRLLKLLDGVGDTRANLREAARGESYEFTTMYRDFERTAREEGFTEIADVFKAIGTVEAHHEARYKKLLDNIENERVFRSETPTKWVCRNCGYVHEGPEPPEVCPACAHPRGFYERLADNF